MDSKIDEIKKELKESIEKISKKFNYPIENIEQIIYDKIQHQCDIEDIKQQLKDMDQPYEENDLEYICSIYRDDYDDSEGTWINAERAISDYFDLNHY